MITINPENPSSDDAVELQFLYYGCGYFDISKTINLSEGEFVVDVVARPCLTVAPPSPLNWSVGRLEPGDYQVILKQVNRDQEIQEFIVLQGELPFPTPSIPSLGVPAAILFAAALAWIANKAFKTDAQKRAA